MISITRLKLQTILFIFQMDRNEDHFYINPAEIFMANLRRQSHDLDISRTSFSQYKTLHEDITHVRYDLMQYII